MPMRQLRSCDFCGEEATGVYEVLPPELSPSEGEQRRVVLCADCRETLEGVLAPLLSRLGVGAAGTPEDDTGSGLGADAGGDPEPGETTSSEPSPTDEDVAPTDSFAADDPHGTAISGSGESEVPDLRTGAGASEADATDPDDADDGVGRDADADPETAGEPEPDPAADGTALPPLDGTGASAPSAGDMGDAGGEREDAPDPEAEGEPTSAPDEEPAEFRTVMRLLGNREFPVDRNEIVELATSAYGLGEGEVDEILAYAVDRGLLDDDGETLRKA